MNPVPSTASSRWPSSSFKASLPTMPLQALADHLQVGDLLFIRLRARPFVEAADVMMTWTNHVGVVLRTTGKEPIIAESVVPMSRLSQLSRVIDRSDHWRVSVKRLPEPLTLRQHARLEEAVRKRLGILYDGGFNLQSRRQFCSKFVREVMAEATGGQLGEIETMADLFHNNPDARVGFWKIWYLGRIPWERKTVTPVSVMLSPTLHTVFEGHVLMPDRVKREQRRLESDWHSGISSLPTA
jgi:hypothetical protein